MTEISNMELIKKMLKSLVILRKSSFANAHQPFQGSMPGFGLGRDGQEFPGRGIGPNGMFNDHQFSPRSRRTMSGDRPMNGAFSMMNGRQPDFSGRQGLVRENLLTIIAAAPEGIRAKQIAAQAGINQSSVSESLGKLEDDGYIRRTTDPTDKRATLIFLTDLGKARASEVEDQQKEMFGHLFDCLTANEKEELGRLLDKIIAGNKK